MATKIVSVSSTGRVRRTINKPSTTERILQLHKALGLSPKEAAKELGWLNVRIASKFVNLSTN